LEQRVQRPAVILIGGEANALSVARELGRQGIQVFGLPADDSCVRHSRYYRRLVLPVAEPGGADGRVLRYLLSEETEPLQGSVLVACSDAGLKLVAEHRDELLKRYRLDLAHPPAQLLMLDKLSTYELARAAGVTTPRFWAVISRDDVVSLRDELVFPLMIKPRLSHVFEQRFGRKHVIVASFEDLIAYFNAAVDADVNVLLVEVIPGGDDLLASYFTYIDEHGKALCHFTKRVIRRHPAGMGAACYHVTGDVPEIVEPSLRLLATAGVRGMANVEFKLDRRDGQYKLIECNARFVASNALVAKAGLRLATFVYHRAIGEDAPLVTISSARPLRLWDPLRDFAAFLQLRRAGQITLWQWLVSVMHRQHFAYFAWSDPGPTLSRLLNGLRRTLPGCKK
jgi:predicted ATP-grasp superfamily ATP-dependent carboligase